MYIGPGHLWYYNEGEEKTITMAKPQEEPSIRVSKKHGVNPSLLQCFYCIKDVGVALMGKLPGDKEAPRRVCADKEPCDECKKHMEAGIILISVREDDATMNPYRTGGWVVLREDAVRRIVQPVELAQHICWVRFAFVTDEAWATLGLPREASRDLAHHDRVVAPTRNKENDHGRQEADGDE